MPVLWMGSENWQLFHLYVTVRVMAAKAIFDIGQSEWLDHASAWSSDTRDLVLS